MHYIGMDIENDWKPRAEDIDFICKLIAMLKDGGIREVPMNHACYVIHQNEKLFELVKGPKDDVYIKTGVILEFLGWSIGVKTQDLLEMDTEGSGEIYLAE